METSKLGRGISITMQAAEEEYAKATDDLLCQAQTELAELRKENALLRQVIIETASDLRNALERLK